MAYTTPTTLASGDGITHTIWNASVRDNFLALADAWTSYTPTLTASTTDPTLGTGATATGRYIKVGRFVAGEFDITFGSSGVAAGSGTYQIGIPANVYASMPGNASVGRAYLFDSSGSVGAWFDLISNYSSLTIRYQATWPTGSLTYVSNSAPWTWAASDVIRGSFLYESAS